MKYEGSEFVLSSGRTFYANGGILGLGEFSDDLMEGYDGYVEINGVFRFPEEGSFTSEERAEIATYMIAKWSRWGGL